MEEVVRINNLTKKCKDKGIYNINLTIYDGEIFGIFGIKGSGKTTILRHLICQMKADKGNCSILDMDTRKNRELLKGHILYIPKDIINFQESIRPSYFEWLMSSMQERNVLFLEEPFLELNPARIEAYIECIKNLRRSGKTICIISETYSELENICDRIALIHGGKHVNTLHKYLFDIGQDRLYRVGFHKKEEYNTFLSSYATCIVSKNGQYNSVIVKVGESNIFVFLQALNYYDLRYTEFVPYNFKMYYSDCMNKVE